MGLSVKFKNVLDVGTSIVLRKLGFGTFDNLRRLISVEEYGGEVPDMDLLLIPSKYYDDIPQGYPVTDIFGKTEPFAGRKTCCKNDVRADGLLPIGVLRPAEHAEECEDTAVEASRMRSRRPSLMTAARGFAPHAMSAKQEKRAEYEMRRHQRAADPDYQRMKEFDRDLDNALDGVIKSAIAECKEAIKDCCRGNIEIDKEDYNDIIAKAFGRHYRKLKAGTEAYTFVTKSDVMLDGKLIKAGTECFDARLLHIAVEAKQTIIPDLPNDAKSIGAPWYGRQSEPIVATSADNMYMFVKHSNGYSKHKISKALATKYKFKPGASYQPAECARWHKLFKGFDK